MRQRLGRVRLRRAGDVGGPVPLARGRLYYVVSVMPVRTYLHTPKPVDLTVVIDAAERTVVDSYNDAAPAWTPPAARFLRPSGTDLPVAPADLRPPKLVGKPREGSAGA